jgi:hypothetical protein
LSAARAERAVTSRTAALRGDDVEEEELGIRGAGREMVDGQ